MVTSLSIRLFMDQKVRLSSDSTKEMHEVAEYGVTASLGLIRKGIKGQGQQQGISYGMNWIKEMMELQDRRPIMPRNLSVQLRKTIWLRRFMSLHQMELSVPFQRFRDRLTLLRNPYKVGEKATGAKVNGRMVPLTTKLKTGDQVEIVTN